MARAASPPPHRAVAAADRLHSAAIHLLRTVRRADATLGVGPAQLSALSVLVFGGPRSVGALARAENVRLPTMSRLVAALERDGLAARATDPGDGRSSVLRPTVAGRRIVLRGRERRVAELARRVARLAAADVDTLERATRVIEGLVGG